MGFIRDWNEVWDDRRDRDEGDARWTEAMTDLQTTHGTSDARWPISSRRPESPHHLVGTEVIMEASCGDEQSTFLTETPRPGGSVYHRYELVRVGNDWRLRELETSERRFPPLADRL